MTKNAKVDGSSLQIKICYVYTLRLIGLISYPGESDLMVHLRKYTASFSHECILLPSCVYNMHQDTKSARLNAVCKRTLRHVHMQASAK